MINLASLIGAGLAFVHYPAAMNQINQATKSKLGTVKSC